MAADSTGAAPSPVKDSSAPAPRRGGPPPPSDAAVIATKLPTHGSPVATASMPASPARDRPVSEFKLPDMTVARAGLRPVADRTVAEPAPAENDFMLALKKRIAERRLKMVENWADQASEVINS
eukprot:TRINITY_DN3038_c0_g1_i1.p2 TRINITY_DN3038_c0_g1~~TRINITY_DN3038_c0_g1_i1.p2  ORF type:complete len:135 (+),score=26.90 TRINITY_DN3038_c0_g1_i1:36-407(+)